MISCPILTRSLCYLLDGSFEIEIKRGRMERIEKVRRAVYDLGGISSWSLVRCRGSLLGYKWFLFVHP